MAKVVFTHKPNSIYDDLPEEKYHFPHTYLRQVERAIGDFVIYYAPRRSIGAGSERMSYYAVAKITNIVGDPGRSGHYYAIIDPATFLQFDHPVPFQINGHYFEGRLRRPDGNTNKGAFGRAVRNLADDEFTAILSAGFHDEDLPPAGSAIDDGTPDIPPGLLETPAEYERPLVERILSRPVRDHKFSRLVREAYDNTCAVTGLRLVNGGGRAEVQAAHIRPVEDRGPDSIRNGIALSGTVHWMFDRGLIAVGEPPDYPIVVSPAADRGQVQRLLSPEMRLIKPGDERFWPSPIYLHWHRRNRFKA